MPVENGNRTVSDGSLPKTLQSILAEIKPESAYFLEEQGHRTAYVVFDLKDASQIPAICEPWFLAFDATVELHPVMTVDDLGKAMGGIQETVKKYGRSAGAKSSRKAP